MANAAEKAAPPVSKAAPKGAAPTKPADPKLVPTVGIKFYAVTPRKTMEVRELDRFGTLVKGGVLVGDELLSFQGTKVAELEAGGEAAWQKVFNGVGIGNSMTVRLVRGGKEIELNMKVLGRRLLNLQLDEVDDVLERKIAPA